MIRLPEPNFKLKGRIIQIFGTAGAFSVVIGESQNVISRVIRGYHSLDETEKEHWAQTLDCEIEDIFRGNGKQNASRLRR